jgi:hypothetical protein
MCNNVMIRLGTIKLMNRLKKKEVLQDYTRSVLPLCSCNTVLWIVSKFCSSNKYISTDNEKSRKHTNTQTTKMQEQHDNCCSYVPVYTESEEEENETRLPLIEEKISYQTSSSVRTTNL